MANNKLRTDALQEQLELLRDASRRQARRRKSTADLVVFASLILFLMLSLLAARVTWEAAGAPLWVALAIGVLAIALQRILGLRIRRGRLHTGAASHAGWWLVAALCGAVVLAAA